MEVFISTKPLNISVKRIIAATVEEFSKETNAKENTKGREEENEGFNVIEAIQSAVQLVELRDLFDRINLFTKSFGGILDQGSIDGIREILTEKVIDDVYPNYFPAFIHTFIKHHLHHS